jgi:hypothetical protein
MGEIKHLQNKVYPVEEICFLANELQVLALTKAAADRIKSYTGMITKEHYEQLKTVATILLAPLRIEKPVIVTMETGLGKSTMIEEFLKFKLNTDNDFGAIVVKERIEDILALEANLNGKAKAVYSFYPDHCLRGCKEYQRIVCKNCEADCKMKRAAVEQKNYPVVIMSSERFRLEMIYREQLNNFLKFCDEKGFEHKRNILIIDEKPPLAINRPITRNDLRKLYEVIRNIRPGLEIYDEAQHLILHLKELNNLLSALEFTAPILQALEPDFKLSYAFKNYFEAVYPENDVEILEHIASLIKMGGVLRNEITKINLEAQAITTDYIEFSKLDGLKIVIFDGTAKYDTEYKDGQFVILDLPEIRNYDNLTIYNCPINVSRTNIFSKKNSERFDFQKLFQDLEGIKGKEVFVLGYQKIVNTIEKCMKNTSFYENNHVYIDHFNNIKGKNIYANCTVMLNVGINHKGDAYYLAKTISISDDIKFAEADKKEDIMVMLEEKMKQVIESDLFTEMIQNFSRTALRKSTDEQVVIYSFINDPELLELLKAYFTNAVIETWYPERFYKHYLMNGSEHDQKLLKLVEFLETQFSNKNIVTKKEIREALGYKDQDTLAKHLKTEYIKKILCKLNIHEEFHSLKKVS